MPGGIRLLIKGMGRTFLIGLSTFSISFEILPVPVLGPVAIEESIFFRKNGEMGAHWNVRDKQTSEGAFEGNFLDFEEFR